MSQTTEAIEGATVVKEAQGGVEFGLTQLRQSLPDILGDDIALTVLCGLVFIDLASCNKDLAEVGVHSKTESRTGDPHGGSLFETAINKLMGCLDWHGTMDILRSTDHKCALVGKGNHSIHEIVKHRALIFLETEVQIFVGNTSHDPICTLLHEGSVGVGAHNQRTSLLSLFNLRLRGGRLGCCHRLWLLLDLWWGNLLDWCRDRFRDHLLLSLDHLLKLGNVLVNHILDLLHLRRAVLLLRLQGCGRNFLNRLGWALIKLNHL